MGQFDYGAKCQEIAAIGVGLSGREIAKMGVAWQVSVSMDGAGANHPRTSHTSLLHNGCMLSIFVVCMDCPQ